MIGPILRRARKGNSRRIIMEARLPHFSHNPRPAPFSAPPRNTNPILGRFFVHSTTGVAVCGAYVVASYLNGKNLAPFFVHSTTAVIVCGAYAVAPYTNTRKNGDFLLHRLKTNPKNTCFPAHSITVVIVCGAYAIRPYTDTRKNGDFPPPRIKTNPKPDEFLSVKVGAYCIRPTSGHASGRMGEKMDRISSVRIGAY